MYKGIMYFSEQARADQEMKCYSNEHLYYNTIVQSNIGQNAGIMPIIFYKTCDIHKHDKDKTNQQTIKQGDTPEKNEYYTCKNVIQ